ncbi:nucleoside triphosphate pyrophosphohydrolase [Lysinibacillus sp. Y5S-8]|uniref:nucleoside triphosphate pyrophosphohydrolase n=1 Tax=Lysinibacillus sp. Y5S-8 TaxID=3122488 RepID=UPI0030CCE9D3
MPVYNKLVRDKILDIIQAKGLFYHARTLESNELLTAIKAKMIEETSEFHDAKDRQANMEELADILELIHAAIRVLGVSYEELDATREYKKIIRGGFENGVYLIDVEDQ